MTTKSMKKPKFTADRNDINTVELDKLTASLTKQDAKHPRQMLAFNPQLQLIISNRYYEEAALAAMDQGTATAAYICPTGLGGWSLELYYGDDDDVSRVSSKYNAECDARGLY